MSVGEHPAMQAGASESLWDNPMGTDGFEFVEYTAPDTAALARLFEQMGFAALARHRSKNVTLYRQGDINFIVNAEPESFAQAFARLHGPSVCAVAFRVRDAAKAYQRALALGARPVAGKVGPMELNIPAIEGIGGSVIYLVDRYGDRTIYDVDFVPTDSQKGYVHEGAGLTYIDHVTHNVHRGHMKVWADFYERIFNFREIRYFDIKGEYTGLTSRAMSAPDGMIRIPLNEEASKATGQIEEFLMQFNGEGIQHIALRTDNLCASVDALRKAGVPLMSAPNDIYYEMLEERLPGHGLRVGELKSRGILLDGRTSPDAPPRLLLQIFSETLFGPVFFEFIERRNDEGFGEGNFKALFESLERDQLRRGTLKAEA